jgi:signal transduction histidine kinase
MKVARAELSALINRESAKDRVPGLIVRTAAPLALCVACLFVTCQVLKSEAVVEDIGKARLVESKLSATFISVHTIKSRRLEYLLTGSERYLSRTDRDLAAVEANFGDLKRLLAGDPEQSRRLFGFQAKAQALLDTTGLAVANFRAGNRALVKETLASPGFTRLMDDNSIGSEPMLGIERARIASLQDIRASAFTNAAVGMFALLLGLALYSIGRIAFMSALMRRQRMTVQTLERATRKAEKARQSAEQARQSAEQASRAKSDFLASVSHELRTPLNAILGFSELIGYQMMGPVGNKRYVEYAADINKSGRHLLALVNDVLDLSKVEAGKMELRESEFSIAALIADSLDLLGEKARSHVSLGVECAPEIPALMGDVKLIKQILLNLVSNAVKFTPDGGWVTIAAHYRGGRGVRIAVSDSGIGMSQDDIEKAMSPFGQIDSRIARSHQGTGLGLPISRSYAELHGGELIIASALGQGTRVTLVLPESRIAQTPQRKPAQKRAG